MASVSAASASLNALESALNDVFMHTGSLFSEANDSDATALARATMRVKNAIPQAAMDFSVALGQLERQLNFASAILQRKRYLKHQVRPPNNFTIDGSSTAEGAQSKQTQPALNNSIANAENTGANDQVAEAQNPKPPIESPTSRVRRGSARDIADISSEANNVASGKTMSDQAHPDTADTGPQTNASENNATSLTSPNVLSESFPNSGDTGPFDDVQLNADSTFDEFFDFDSTIGQDHSNTNGSGSFDDSRFNDDFFNLDVI